MTDGKGAWIMGGDWGSTTAALVSNATSAGRNPLHMIFYSPLKFWIGMSAESSSGRYSARINAPPEAHSQPPTVRC